MIGSVSADVALATGVAEWALALVPSDLPADVVRSTRLRVLDVLGLALAGSQTRFGRAIRTAATTMSPAGPARIVGTGEAVGITAAAFANAAFAQALEFDDTHNESIVHMSSPAVAAGLALSGAHRISGERLIAAIAAANEISCRIGSVAAGELHRRGFHPTGLFAPFGVTVLAARLLGLDSPTTAHALGICGSFAAGILECWVDGTDAKFLHSGAAAQNGIAAALLAQAGVSGPPRVLEGRFGLFASHLQDPDATRNFDRVVDGLGREWESRNSSFKPYPVAHVLHPYIDAALRIRHRHGIDPRDIAGVECPVAPFIVPIVCEPVVEKRAPATEAHGRVCLQYTVAEALWRGSMGRSAYESYRDPEILALARLVRYVIDPDYPGPGRFKGAVEITLRDGRRIVEIQEDSLGSPANPMTEAQLRAKFDDNASGVLDTAARDRLADMIAHLDTVDDASALIDLTIGSSTNGRPVGNTNPGGTETRCEGPDLQSR
jgi:2-methylcitrate dehydratase PrpD